MMKMKKWAKMKMKLKKKGQKWNKAKNNIGAQSSLSSLTI